MYSTMVVEKFQIYSFKTTANTSVSLKIESVQFYRCPPTKAFPQVFIIIPQAEMNCPFLPNSIFWRYCLFSLPFFIQHFSLSRKRGERIMLLKRVPKLTRVLVTSFDKFHYLCNLYVLLCNNLASSMRKCEGSLTKLIKFSLKSRTCRNNYMK